MADKPSFEINFNPVSLNTLTEQSDRSALITVVLLQIIAMCEKEDCLERSMKVDDLFCLFVWSSTQTGLAMKLKPPFKNPTERSSRPYKTLRLKKDNT